MIDPAIINSNTLYAHIHCGLEQPKTIADFKAINMNVMRSSINATHNVYSRLAIMKSIQGLIV
jgi:hypothetical protein